MPQEKKPRANGRWVKVPIEERLWPKVDRSGGRAACWPWLGAHYSTGYGSFGFAAGDVRMAHRVVFEAVVGPIPEGMQLDHRCHDPRACVGGAACPHRNCVNPAHLEPVLQRTNLLRGGGASARNAAKTHCPAGHPLSGDNLVACKKPRRVCRTCHNRRR